MKTDSAGIDKIDQFLILFVADHSPRSTRARTNLKAALERAGLDGWPREIDTLEEPQQAIDFGISAIPTLLRTGQKDPDVMLYGDLSDENALMRFLSQL